MIKRIIIVFILALAVFNGSIFVYADSDVKVNDTLYDARVKNISNRRYFDAVKEAIKEAKESIYMTMYIIQASGKGNKRKVDELLDELARAKERGVEVKVILDENIDFTNKGRKTLKAEMKSLNAYRFLKEKGIDVYYDESSIYTHAKAIVIDREIVIAGSTNWTNTSLERSFEVTTFTKSKPLAEEILEEFKDIEIREGVDEFIEEKDAISVSMDFLEGPGLAPQMVKDNDERAFDTYLYLIRDFQKTGQVETSLFYDDLAKRLGIFKKMDRTAYRRQIIKVLRRLEEKYHLIEFKPRYSQEASIRLLDYKDPKKPYSYPVTGYIRLQDEYFEFGWDRCLSLRAKFSYFINLTMAAKSDNASCWSKSVKEITQEFGNVSKFVISRGMGELRRHRLLEVSYDVLIGKPYRYRKPNTYRVLNLYNPDKLKEELNELKLKYGEKEYKKAMEYARIVFEENNPDTIEGIILKTKQYGREKMKKAFNIIKQKNTDNPKKTYEYVVGILEGME